MSRIQFTHTYEHIITIENLLLARREFLSGKKMRKDVLEFERNLMANIIELHEDLSTRTYKHREYRAFNISDPKPRNIHKASVRDRLLHHALYRVLYPFFDCTFISDSYSCRVGKGTHKAVERFRTFSYKVSKNNTRTCWILKCDVRKFFASIDHAILKEIIGKYIQDKSILGLLGNIIDSFETVRGSTSNSRGLPLGNLTSQLLVNIYMNEFDQYVKHKLKAKYYIRYADDFVFLSDNRKFLENLLPKIEVFLNEKLGLTLHPNKVSIGTLSSGVDFLGWIHFTDHSVMRGATKRRMFRTIVAKQGKEETVQSYLGLLGHGNARILESQIEVLLQKVEDSSC